MGEITVQEIDGQLRGIIDEISSPDLGGGVFIVSGKVRTDVEDTAFLGCSSCSDLGSNSLLLRLLKY